MNLQLQETAKTVISTNICLGLSLEDAVEELIQSGVESIYELSTKNRMSLVSMYTKDNSADMADVWETASEDFFQKLDFDDMAKKIIDSESDSETLVGMFSFRKKLIESIISKIDNYHFGNFINIIDRNISEPNPPSSSFLVSQFRKFENASFYQ